MTNTIKYYLIPRLTCIDPTKNLKSKIRIAAFHVDFPFKPEGLIGHESLRHLRKHESHWQELKKTDSRTADKLSLDKFIMDCNDCVFTPRDKEFNKYALDLLQHTIHGKLDKEFKGVHLISKFNTNISKINQLGPVDKNGVWKAEFEIYSKKRDKFYPKKSTFFPRNWTPSHFMFESFVAIKRLKIIDTIEKYNSTTSSGIPVTIIIKNGRAKSIYPIYQTE